MLPIFKKKYFININITIKLKKTQKSKFTYKIKNFVINLCIIVIDAICLNIFPIFTVMRIIAQKNISAITFIIIYEKLKVVKKIKNIQIYTKQNRNISIKIPKRVKSQNGHIVLKDSLGASLFFNYFLFNCKCKNAYRNAFIFNINKLNISINNKIIKNILYKKNKLLIIKIINDKIIWSLINKSNVKMILSLLAMRNCKSAYHNLIYMYKKNIKIYYKNLKYYYVAIYNYNVVKMYNNRFNLFVAQINLLNYNYYKLKLKIIKISYKKLKIKLLNIEYRSIQQLPLINYTKNIKYNKNYDIIFLIKCSYLKKKLLICNYVNLMELNIKYIKSIKSLIIILFYFIWLFFCIKNLICIKKKTKLLNLIKIIKKKQNILNFTSKLLNLKIKKYKKKTIKIAQTNFVKLPIIIFIKIVKWWPILNFLKLIKNLILKFNKKYIKKIINQIVNFEILNLFWFNLMFLKIIKLKIINIFLKIIKIFSIPLRIFVRVVLITTSLILAILKLTWNDLLNTIIHITKYIKNSSFELIFRLEIIMCIILFMSTTISKILIQTSLQVENNIIFFVLLGIVNTLSPMLYVIKNQWPLLLIVEYSSMYYSAASSKKLMYSTYYLVSLVMLLGFWFFPEYVIFENFYTKIGGFLLIIMYLFRGLREDHKFNNLIGLDPFKFWGDKLSYISKKRNSIIFRLRDRIHNPFTEFICLISVTYLFYINNDININIENLEFFQNNINMYSKYILIIVIAFVVLRQSSYSFLIWGMLFSYIFIWVSLTSIFLIITNFSYFGLLGQNIINETTAISSLGLISSQFGLELLTFGNYDESLNTWYFGELFVNKLNSTNLESKLELINYTNNPYNSTGDMRLAPQILTPHDDHNWTIVKTLEMNYFNAVKMNQSISDNLQADVTKYWLIDRNSNIWFGEFLEKDLYYGWSHRTIIDTETYFDYSPYGLTNIFGDGLTKNILTDIFNIFSGPVELDEQPTLNLTDWGSSNSVGSTSNKLMGGAGSLETENQYSFDINQRVRENGEYYHEWFPGMYVLDGRFDSKQAKFFIKLFLYIIVPIMVIIFWYTINGKPSTNMDETFGEMEVTNYNFFFFGNEQVESFVTYTWNPIINSNLEWPIDELPLDPIAYEPTSDLFGNILSYTNTGLFTPSILDSFFYVPILKHSEGFTTGEYKDHLMPIIFPIAYKTRNETSKNLYLNTYYNEQTKSNTTDDSSLFVENQQTNPIKASYAAYELNLEYSNLFESLLLELEDTEVSKARDLEYEFIDSNTDESTSSEHADADGNFNESGLFEDDTVIDDPMTREMTNATEFLKYLEKKRKKLLDSKSFGYLENSTFKEDNTMKFEEAADIVKILNAKRLPESYLFAGGLGEDTKRTFINYKNIPGIDYKKKHLVYLGFFDNIVTKWVKNKIKNKIKKIKYKTILNNKYYSSIFLKKNKVINKNLQIIKSWLLKEIDRKFSYFENLYSIHKKYKNTLKLQSNENFKSTNPKYLSSNIFGLTYHLPFFLIKIKNKKNINYKIIENKNITLKSKIFKINYSTENNIRKFNNYKNLLIYFKNYIKIKIKKSVQIKNKNKIFGKMNRQYLIIFKNPQKIISVFIQKYNYILNLKIHKTRKTLVKQIYNYFKLITIKINKQNKSETYKHIKLHSNKQTKSELISICNKFIKRKKAKNCLIQNNKNLKIKFNASILIKKYNTLFNILSTDYLLIKLINLLRNKYKKTQNNIKMIITPWRHILKIKKKIKNIISNYTKHIYIFCQKLNLLSEKNWWCKTQNIKKGMFQFHVFFNRKKSKIFKTVYYKYTYFSSITMIYMNFKICLNSTISLLNRWNSHLNYWIKKSTIWKLDYKPNILKMLNFFFKKKKKINFKLFASIHYKKKKY